MLFNSYSFIVIFLPVAVVVFFFLSKAKLTTGSKIWLILVSLFFYGWWNAADLRIIAGSILVNFAAGVMLAKIKTSRMKKIILLSGIAVNLSALAYYKYYNFFISNINSIADLHLKLVAMSLPLGISFFTFTQIAFLVDAYRNQVQEYDFINYSLFVTFFPHLLAGPIIHHKEMMPQFDRLRNKIINYDNLSRGLLLFAIGLFKKVMIADSFAVWANAGFKNPSALNFLESWATSLSYSLQLYYDFSGYTDMAIGAALFFNIRLPANFNSPYRASDIQDFWRRWHITLSRFLREYVYIPLGGNRRSEGRTLSNLLVTFLLGGIWHGAGWTFLVWGALHGLAIIVHRLWLKYGLALNNVVGWFITFNFVNITWIFFRANSFTDAFSLLKGMMGMRGVNIASIKTDLVFFQYYTVHSLLWLQNINGNVIMIVMIVAYLLFACLGKNSDELESQFRPSAGFAVAVSMLLVVSLLSMLSATSHFIYFTF
jgi:alginate O-acetyltransferase complex protein AlgI